MPRRLPYGIHTAGMEGMAFQQPSNCHKPPLDHAIPLDGILRIDRTGWIKTTSGPDQWRNTGAIDRQEYKTEAPQREGSPKRANRCLSNVARHMFCNSTNGRFRHSRFGNTRKACPGTNTDRAARPSSRNRRFARFRRTAVPNRRPITIPIIASWDKPEQIWRLNNPVETRRPLFLMCWISRLRFKKNGTDFCPAVITNPPAGYLTASPGRPEIAHRHIDIRQPGKAAVPTPG